VKRRGRQRDSKQPTSDRVRQQLFERLITDHSPALHSYVPAFLDDHHQAGDIVQKTVLRVWYDIDVLCSGEGSVRGWLLTVARNLAIDWLRNTRARARVAQPDHAGEVVARGEASRLLGQLSTEHAVVLVHRTIAGRTEATDGVCTWAAGGHDQVSSALRAPRPSQERLRPAQADQGDYQAADRTSFRRTDLLYGPTSHCAHPQRLLSDE
jgi:RNA polymerase sigma-70 factor (ECF subfamily)